MGVMDDAPRVHLSTRAEWREWLAANHGSEKGVWLVSAKRQTGLPSIGYEEAVEEALCFGWIDGRYNRLDGEWGMQWFSPRRPKSTWARTNKERVARLEAAGLMTAAGRAAIEAAKINGSWDSLNDIDALVLPAELDAALAAHEDAREYFDSRSPSARRMAIAYVSQVKRPELRAARAEKVAAVCVRKEPLARAWQPAD